MNFAKRSRPFRSAIFRSTATQVRASLLCADASTCGASTVSGRSLLTLAVLLPGSGAAGSECAAVSSANASAERIAGDSGGLSELSRRDRRGSQPQHHAGRPCRAGA